MIDPPLTPMQRRDARMRIAAGAMAEYLNKTLGAPNLTGDPDMIVLLRVVKNSAMLAVASADALLDALDRPKGEAAS